MLPDGPGFAEAFAGAIQPGVVPLPVHPLLPAHDLVTVAAEAGAHVVLASVDQIPALAELDAEPPVLINGPHGPGPPRCDCVKRGVHRRCGILDRQSLHPQDGGVGISTAQTGRWCRARE
jgi:acyl-coenzyme A synthetase/AMP-(fatty) acid ligase